MKRAFTYFLLQTKRIFRYMPAILAFSLVLSIVAALALNVIIAKNENSEEDIKLTIGIVGETEDSYLGFGFVTIMELDISRFAIDFQSMTEEEAKSKLENGELSAYVKIPDNFIDNAAHGDIVPLKYVASSSDVGITEVFKTEILNGLCDILETAQRAIYGFEAALNSNGAKSGITKRMNALYESYVALIMDRSDFVTLTESGYSSSVSMLGYYLCGIILIFLSLWGICCCAHFSKRQTALSRLLASKGSGAVVQIIGEYLSYFIAMAVTMSLVLGSATIILQDKITKIPEITSVGFFISFLIKLIPIFFAISAMQFLIFEIFSSVAPCVIAQFTVAIVFSYACGLFYPIDFLPKAMQSVSHYLPIGVAREYSCSLLRENFDTRGFCFLILFAFIFICASVILRKNKIVGRIED